MYLTYRFRIYPSAHQTVILDEKYDMVRNAYNTLVRWSRKTNMGSVSKDIKEQSGQEEDRRLPSPGQPLDHLADYFLAAVNSHDLTDRSILVSVLRIFSHNRKMAVRSKCTLKYKSGQYSKQTICFLASNQKVNISATAISVPLLGQVKTSVTRKPTGRMISLTVSKTAAGRYYISLLVKKQDTRRNTYKTLLKQKVRIVGIDVGLSHFATLSDGTKYMNPKHLDQHLQDLRRCHRELSRKDEASHNRDKARLSLARKYAHVNNKRRGFLHMLSTELVRKYDVIAIESIEVTHLMQQRSLARKIADASWKQFMWMLRYKAKQQGKIVIEVPRYLPSSRQCCRCRTINRKLTLKDREWTCPVCQTQHDRDINAAINIMAAATHMLLHEWPSVIPSTLQPVLSERR